MDKVDKTGPDRDRQPVMALVSLGCAKNTVDSELVLARFVESGWLVAEDPADADLCLVNTCGFIHDAREESAAVLRELRAAKAGGGPQAIVALGCLVRRVAGCPELEGFLAAADARVGFNDYARLPEICLALLGAHAGSGPAQSYGEFLSRPRLRIGSPHTAYLKIAEGCSNACAFCSIPRIRGRQASRPPADIVAEARSLAEAGACEINLIAQDTTAYGKDFDGQLHLAALLARLRDEVDADLWFRLMYACPQHLSRGVLERLASDARFCRYLDMPLQHISDRQLALMGRPATRARTLDTLALVREILPDCAIRTAFITGHPGETEADFAELAEFVAQGWFAHAGVFAYSPEPGTRSAALPAPVPDEVKAERRLRLMEIQRAVSAAHCAAQVGKTVEVMVDGAVGEGPDVPEGAAWIARSQGQAPEVDGVFFLPGFDAVPGDRFDVAVAAALDYDYIAG